MASSTKRSSPKSFRKMTGVPLTRLDLRRSRACFSMQDGRRTAQENRHQPARGHASAIGRESCATKFTQRSQRSPNRPMGCFVFAGPDGRRQNATWRSALATFMFGDPDDALDHRSTCPSTWKSTTSRRLIGAPPGYVGYEEGGQLTERDPPTSLRGQFSSTRSRKAHPDVFNHAACRSWKKAG